MGASDIVYQVNLLPVNLLNDFNMPNFTGSLVKWGVFEMIVSEPSIGVCIGTGTLLHLNPEKQTH